MIRFPLSVRGIGGFLVFAGIVSCVLRLVGFNLRILLWVDLGGPARPAPSVRSGASAPTTSSPLGWSFWGSGRDDVWLVGWGGPV